MEIFKKELEKFYFIVWNVLGNVDKWREDVFYFRNWIIERYCKILLDLLGMDRVFKLKLVNYKWKWKIDYEIFEFIKWRVLFFFVVVFWGYCLGRLGLGGSWYLGMYLLIVRFIFFFVMILYEDDFENNLKYRV